MEDINFEIEGLSDEELESAFEEHFGCKKKKRCSEDDGEGEPEGGDNGSSDPEPESEPEPEDETVEEEVNEDPEDETDSDDGKGKRKYSIDENGNMTLIYELSHEDIRNSLYNLMCAEDEWWNWIIETYNDSFIYQSGEDGRFYKREYYIDGDNVSLSEEKTEVFSEWLTQEEKDAIAALKADYAKLKEFKDNFDSSELKAKKDAIFDREE